MTQTEQALTIAAAELASRDNSRTADAWRDYLMQEAERDFQRQFEARWGGADKDKRRP